MNNLRVDRTKKVEHLMLLLKPEIWSTATSDMDEQYKVSLSNDEIDHLQDDDVYVVVATIDEIVTGIVVYHDIGDAYEVHLNILPEYRKYSYTIGELFKEWFFNNVPSTTLIAKIPEMYPNVIRFTKSQGFSYIGTESKTFKKNNVLYDKHIFQLRKI